MYLGNGIDNVLVVIVAVHHALRLKCTKIAHYLALHTLQWKTERDN